MKISQVLIDSRLLFLYGVIFFVPFEYWTALYVLGQTPSKFLGVFYLALTIVTLSQSYSLNKYSKIIIIPVLLWFWLFFSGLLNGVVSNFPMDYAFLFQYSYLILFFFLVVNEIRINPSVRQGVLVSLVLSLVTIAIFIQLGIGVQGQDAEVADSLEEVQRIWFFGLNPNLLGNYAAFAILFCVFLYYEFLKTKVLKILFVSFIPLLFMVLGFAGSSGAFLAVILGLTVYFLMRKENIAGKVKYVLLGLLLLAAAFYMLAGFEYLSGKLERFYETGSTTGRTDIWFYALQIIVENPFIGLGKAGAEQTLEISRAGHYTAHNVYLDVAMWGGVVGLLLYLGFFFFLFLCSMRYRAITTHASSLSLLLVVAFLMVKSGGGFTNKYVWLLLPYVAWYPVAHRNT